MLEAIIQQAVRDILTGDNAMAPSPQQTPIRKIVVLDMGFIFYGDISYESGRVVGRNGGQIRHYNEPSGGLPWLAANKPSEKTKLDRCDSWSAPAERVINEIDIQKGGI